MKVNVVLPFLPNRSVGGIKIMYQYADYLAQKGHKVVVYHTNIVKNAPKSFLNPLRYVKNKMMRKDAYPSWYSFRNSVECRLIDTIADSTIADGDAILSTMYATALDVFELSASKGKKINVIQDYETWITSKENLIRSYQLPIIHIVINDYLKQIVDNYSPQESVLIYNAIDTDRFYLKKDIDSRDAHSVCMMYSEEERKGSKYGLAALELCKKEIEDLKVTFFSVYPKPATLPSWIDYHQSPTNLIDIYNSSAIFFTPSLGEGWALPPAEAMRCGCALVCTDIGGHAAYAKEDKTALLVESKNVEDMKKKLLALLNDNEKRVKIATQGNEYVDSFTWDNAIKSVEETFKI